MFLSDKPLVVGTYSNRGFARPETGFLYQGGKFTSITLPGNRITELHAANDADLVLGITPLDPAFRAADKAFLYRNGSFYDLDIPGFDVDAYDLVLGLNNAGDIVDINNDGEIVGIFLDEDHNVHGFLATPVPEPAPGILVICGAACCWPAPLDLQESSSERKGMPLES